LAVVGPQAGEQEKAQVLESQEAASPNPVATLAKDVAWESPKVEDCPVVHKAELVEESQVPWAAWVRPELVAAPDPKRVAAYLRELRVALLGHDLVAPGRAVYPVVPVAVLAKSWGVVRRALLLAWAATARRRLADAVFLTLPTNPVATPKAESTPPAGLPPGHLTSSLVAAIQAKGSPGSWVGSDPSAAAGSKTTRAVEGEAVFPPLSPMDVTASRAYPLNQLLGRASRPR
jgi:hypothetical protein